MAGLVGIKVTFFHFCFVMSNSMFLATNVARASVLCPIYARRYRPDRSYRLGRLLGRLRQTFHGTRKEERSFRYFVDFQFRPNKKVGHYAITIMLILA